MKNPINAAEVINYVWDSAGVTGSYGIGRMASMTDASGMTKFGYDHRGNMTAKVQAIGTSTAATLGYTYDLSDRITAITYPSGRIVTYARDTKGRVAEISTRATAASPLVYLMANTVYDPFGSLKQAGFGNGTVLLQDRGNDGRLALKQLYRSIDNGAISSFAYAYDNDDNMTGITDQVTPANTQTYAYDNRGRLVRATAAATSSAAYKRQDFGYDANGNRTAVSWRTNATDASAAATDTYTRTAAKNRIASITATAGTGATTNAGTRSFTHDARGNLSAESRPSGTATPTSVTTAYDGYGRLKSYSRSAGITNQNMVYNGIDDRVRQATTGGTVQARYVYDSQGRMLGDYLAGATAAGTRGEYIYLNPDAANDNASPYGGDDGMGGYGLLAVATKDAANAPVIHYIHSNHLGVPILTLNSTGAVIAAGSYTQPVFPGQMKTYADLYYNRYRDYDPTTGRYIQADPIGLAGGDNPYLYAEGNPVRYVDPDGLQVRPQIVRPRGPDGRFIAMSSTPRRATPQYRPGEFFVGPPGFRITPSDLARARGQCIPGENVFTQYGRQAHYNYQDALGGSYQYNVRLPSGRRPDAIDYNRRTVRELKPDNPRGRHRGKSQLEKYLNELEATTGQVWQGMLDLYRTPW